jgi:uncharacterized membrane protein
MEFIKSIGPLRGMLAFIVLAVIAIAPLSGNEGYETGWEVIRGAVAPALAVIFVFVLLLDILMSLIFRVDQAEAERRRYQRIIYLNALLVAGLLLAWAPVIIVRLRYYM